MPAMGGKQGKQGGGEPQIEKKPSAFSASGSFDDRVETMVNKIKEEKGESRQNMCVCAKQTSGLGVV